MIKCPKCGFEQPKDIFCAQCGVNMSSYQPSMQSLVGDVRRSFKSFLVIVLILAGCYVMLKALGRVLQYKSHIVETEITESTQLGVGASNLTSGKKFSKVAKSQNQEINPDTHATTHETKAVGEKKEKSFHEVTATFGIAEMSAADFPAETVGKKWHVVHQANILNSFLTQEMTLHKGSNNFVYDDGVIHIDEVLNLEEISDKEIHARITYHRNLKVQDATGRNESAEFDHSIPINEELVLVDLLPRRLRTTRTDSILSTLFHSPSFLAHSSEMVQIIKFENPRTVSQE